MRIYRYDPAREPNAKDWELLDEQERIDIVARRHRQDRVKLPNEILHASIHVVVENQLAMGIQDVRDALQRLMAEGLNRHDALHAVGMVLSGHMFELLKGKSEAAQPIERYYEELRKLTAESWRKMASEEDE